MTDAAVSFHAGTKYRTDEDEAGAHAPHVKLINKFPTPINGGCIPIAFAATASLPVALPAGTYHFDASESCYFAYGSATPVATTSDTFQRGTHRMGWYFPEDTYISVIRATADGTLLCIRVQEN